MFTGSTALRGWRSETRQSQVAVARSLGVGQSTVAEWEAGGRRPEFHLAVRLEALSGGVVTLEAWGYDAAVVAAMGTLVDRRRAEAA